MSSLTLNVKPVIAETFGEIPSGGNHSFGAFEGDSYDNLRENLSGELAKFEKKFGGHDNQDQENSILSSLL